MANFSGHEPLLYISPSSYRMWRLCPRKFWEIKRSNRDIKSEQGIPAALGSAFDWLVKRWLAKERLKIADEPRLLNTALIKQVNLEEGPLRNEIIDKGKDIATIYIHQGLAQRLYDDGLVNLELKLTRDFPNGVRTLGILDAVKEQPRKDKCPACEGSGLNLIKEQCRVCEGTGTIDSDKKIYAPVDWKVRGYKNKNPASPTPGYKTYVTADGTTQMPHDRQHQPLEQLNEDWAIQMAMYAWMLNPDIFPGWIDLPVHIEEICFTSKGIVFTQLKTVVSAKYQQYLYQDLERMWKSQAREPDPVIPNKMRCNAFGKACEVMSYCPDYKLKYSDDMAVFTA